MSQKENMEHYYSKTPVSDYNENIIECHIMDISMRFVTSSGVFSKNGLDFGSRLLIEAYLEDYDNDGTILDVGCGYGPIGIFAAAVGRKSHVDMADVNERAIELAMKNIELNKIRNAEVFYSDGFSEVKKNYDIVITNPPIRAGKKVIFSFYKGAFDHLKEGGSFYCVIQKKQGAESSQKELKRLFGNCEVISRKSGYRILKSLKTQ